ncbi:50S ribosomal protein 6, chloroplastic-like [Melia azedarach]|uniref:50S ribosomal protein 6, chloroplastic-like n=1 Tax=Melia azedarach TaxID=155640 RepID=A0ACC1WQR5_MELAZ|nr:50S ribosomal protein 6, chloroplastic-like [Melia azedarach]
MSVSSFLGSRIALAPNFSTRKVPAQGKSNVKLVIENSSRPKKKATAHHMKTRPRKTQAWDINRKPTVYAPLPPLPPDWTIVSDNSDSVSDGGAAGAGAETAVSSPAALQAPLASG